MIRFDFKNLNKSVQPGGGGGGGRSTVAAFDGIYKNYKDEFYRTINYKN